MQVMPDTGRWMRWYAGRPLRLRDTHDNIQAGMMTLRVLRSWTKQDANAIAAYYQGLGAVRRRGYFDDTKAYVRSVRAHQRRLSPPAARASTDQRLGSRAWPRLPRVPGRPARHARPAGDHGELGVDLLPDQRPARPGPGAGLPRRPVRRSPRSPYCCSRRARSVGSPRRRRHAVVARRAVRRRADPADRRARAHRRQRRRASSPASTSWHPALRRAAAAAPGSAR